MLPRIYDGSGKPAPERITLRAGQLTLEYEAGMLRYIRLGSTELIRGIYAAVRDQNWGTIPATLRDVKLEADDEAFTLIFTSDHQQGDIHFVWQGKITGTADSIITFSFEGEALTSFRRNRVGFCVLHPINVAGKLVTIEHVNAPSEQSQFPKDISPHQPFFDIRAITHDVSSGVQCEVRMEGDTFEMEDQRNWTDASFKTYCTPLALPFPMLLEAGTQVSQSITVRLIGALDNVQANEPAPTLHLNSAVSAPLPPMGLSAASHGEPLTEYEIQRLKALNLSHLQVELRHDGDPETRLKQVWSEAQAIDAQLEVALFLSADSDLEAELQFFHDLFQSVGIKGSVLVFRDGEVATGTKTIETALRIFADSDLKLGAGTNGYFTQLNRNRPDPELFDQSSDSNLSTLVYSINPQVHAFDNASLVETLPVIHETLETLRSFASVARIAVSPITFKIRSNPDATAPDAPTPPGQLPRQVDPRQMSLFGAGWTLGTIPSLASADVTLTYFETTGWLGVMERESGSPLPKLFPSTPGGVYPMYHIFADVGEFRGGEVLSFTSSHPLQFSGLALRAGDRLRLLIANHTQERQTITLTGINGTFEVKSLDDTTVEIAINDPEGYRASSGKQVTTSVSGLQLELLPYAIVRLDQRV
jgi:hypothetical protein